MMTPQHILSLIPHREPFRFIDHLEHADREGAQGHYTFREDEYFFKGHFPDKPIVPGVILVEVMAQIGVLPCALVHINPAPDSRMEMAFTHCHVDFLHPVYPGDTLQVSSSVTRFRLGKIYCEAEARNQHGTLCCKGSLQGISKPTPA